MELEEFKETCESLNLKAKTKEGLATLYATIAVKKANLKATETTLRSAAAYCYECTLADEYFDGVNKALAVIAQQHEALRDLEIKVQIELEKK